MIASKMSFGADIAQTSEGCGGVKANHRFGTMAVQGAAFGFGQDAQRPCQSPCSS